MVNLHTETNHAENCLSKVSENNILENVFLTDSFQTFQAENPWTCKSNFVENLQRKESNVVNMFCKENIFEVFPYRDENIVNNFQSIDKNKFETLLNDEVENDDANKNMSNSGSVISEALGELHSPTYEEIYLNDWSISSTDFKTESPENSYLNHFFDASFSSSNCNFNSVEPFIDCSLVNPFNVNDWGICQVQNHILNPRQNEIFYKNLNSTHTRFNVSANCSSKGDATNTYLNSDHNFMHTLPSIEVFKHEESDAYKNDLEFYENTYRGTVLDREIKSENNCIESIDEVFQNATNLENDYFRFEEEEIQSSSISSQITNKKEYCENPDINNLSNNMFFDTQTFGQKKQVQHGNDFSLKSFSSNSIDVTHNTVKTAEKLHDKRINNYKIRFKHIQPLKQKSKSSKFVEESELDAKEPRVCRWQDCNVTFPSRDAMSRHIEKLHIDQKRGDEFTCFWAACPRRYRPFNARYKLLIHMRVHSGEKPNKCTYKGCEKAFSRLENLKIHYRSHTGDRPYVCVFTNCTKAFSNSSDRAKHQRTHFDAKPYVCLVPGCKKKYTDPSSLRKHVKNHTVKEQEFAKRKIRHDGSLHRKRDFEQSYPETNHGFFDRTKKFSGHNENNFNLDIKDEHAFSSDCVPELKNTDTGYPGYAVRFSLKCHVLSRRPTDQSGSLNNPENIKIPEVSQEDLDTWVNISV